MDLRLEAALDGNLDAFQEGIRTAWLEAGRDALSLMEDRGLERLRGSMISAGLGERLSHTWQGEVFPRQGLSYNPALLFFSKAPEIVRAQEGETIRSAAGHWLAVPIPGSPAEHFPARGETKVEYARRKYGDRLFLIPARAGRLAMLAVEGVSLTNTGRLSVRNRTKTGKWGKGTATIFLFWLVPQVTLEPRLDVAADFRWIEEMFAEEFPKALAEQLVRRGLGDST